MGKAVVRNVRAAPGALPTAPKADRQSVAPIRSSDIVASARPSEFKNVGKPPLDQVPITEDSARRPMLHGIHPCSWQLGRGRRRGGMTQSSARGPVAWRHSTLPLNSFLVYVGELVFLCTSGTMSFAFLKVASVAVRIISQSSCATTVFRLAHGGNVGTLSVFPMACGHKVQQYPTG